MTEDVETRRKTPVATPAELTAAREARGMSQVDISQRIKLQVRQVSALEEGRWDALPGRSFVRGALRSYGKLLDVDVAPLLETIGGFAEPSQVSTMQPLDASTSRRSSGLGFNGGGRGHPILWIIACLVGVVALVLYFGSDQDASRIRSWFPAANDTSGGAAKTAPPAPPPAGGEPSTPPGFGSSPPAATPATGAGITATPSAGSPTSAIGPAAVPDAGSGGPSTGSSAAPGSGGPASSAANPAGVTGPPSPPSSSQTPSSPSSPAPGNPPSQAAAAPAGSAAAPGATAASGAAVPGTAAADARGSVRLKATRDAWVEVRNADGSVLHNGLVKAGSTTDLKGTPPYRLVLGNASRLQLTYEGKPQDLKPHIQSSDIAKLQLQ